MSSSNASPSTSQNRSNNLYSLASRVPLIKSPSVSIPTPVQLPPDLHPLPADISAYFVYPFSLESYVLDPNTPSSSTIDQLLEKHKQYLEGREREKREREEERLRKMAPGWTGVGGVLMPTSTGGVKDATAAGKGGKSGSLVGEEAEKQKKSEQKGEERTPLDDLADHLAQLDALDATRRAPIS
ncbi:hypothetical protein NDA13_006529 [Ustilago tritici]|nr:hypothetical protein NDA13_006529 [Ustilago tritici]